MARWGDFLKNWLWIGPLIGTASFAASLLPILLGVTIVPSNLFGALYLMAGMLGFAVAGLLMAWLNQKKWHGAVVAFLSICSLTAYNTYFWTDQINRSKLLLLMDVELGNTSAWASAALVHPKSYRVDFTQLRSTNVYVPALKFRTGDYYSFRYAVPIASTNNQGDHRVWLIGSIRRERPHHSINLAEIEHFSWLEIVTPPSDYRGLLPSASANGQLVCLQATRQPLTSAKSMVIFWSKQHGKIFLAIYLFSLIEIVYGTLKQKSQAIG